MAEPAAKRARGRPRMSAIEPKSVAPKEAASISESPAEPHIEGSPSALTEHLEAVKSDNDDWKMMNGIAPAPKRKRGRPRKSAPPVDDTAADDPVLGAADQEPVTKRARGRPDKKLSGNGQGVGISAAGPTIPKRRGRPPKSAPACARVDGTRIGTDPEFFNNYNRAKNAQKAAAQDDSLDGYESAQETPPKYEELSSKVVTLETELARVKQEQTEQWSEFLILARSLQEEVAELREILILSNADASRAVLKKARSSAMQDPDLADAVAGDGIGITRPSGALSTNGRKVLRGISHHEYFDPEGGEVEGALIGDVADFTGLELEEVMNATDELSAFGLINRTNEDNAWAINDEARQIIKS